MLKWLGSIDWLPVGACALAVTAVLILLAEIPPNAQHNGTPSQEAGQVIAPISTEDRLADYTGGLELFTGLLAFVTIVLAGASIWQGYIGKQSADAATKSADAVIAAERARFHIIIDRNNLRDFIKLAAMYTNTPDMPVSGNIRIEYHFKNYGKCPGRITEISHGIWLAETPPDSFVYTVIRQAPREYMVPSLGETELQICERTQAIETMQNAIAIRTGHAFVWFFGRFDYVDFVTNKPQVHRFLLRYIQTESLEWRFQSFDYKHYNQST